MRNIKLLGVSVLALFVFGAFAASAWASPGNGELVQCAKVSKTKLSEEEPKAIYHGKYSLKTCATEASETEQKEGKKNKYEIEEYPEGPVTGKGKAVTIKITGEGAKAETITCKKSSAAGEIYENSLVYSLTLEKCSNGEAKENCGTGGKIETGEWGLFVAFANEAETEMLANTAPFFPPEFKCGTETITLKGNEYLLGAITGNGKDLIVKYAVNGGGEQELQTYYEEGKPHGPSTLAHGGTLTGELEFKLKGIYVRP